MKIINEKYENFYNQHYKNKLDVNYKADLIYDGIVLGNLFDETYEAIKNKEIWRVAQDFTYLDLPFAEICNLRCPSCRKETILNHQFDNAQKVYDEISKICLESKIISGATGDFFANTYMMKVIQNLPQENNIVGIEFHTNGTLIKSRWDSLKNIHDKLIKFYISIDGWAKETYEENRFPAKFEIIKKNLEFLKEINTNNRYYINLIMVIQENNYNEISLLLDNCKALDCKYSIKLISNWGTFTEKEFKSKAIHCKDHAKYENFIKVLLDNNIPPIYIHACDWNESEKLFIEEYKYRYENTHN